MALRTKSSGDIAVISLIVSSARRAVPAAIVAAIIIFAFDAIWQLPGSDVGAPLTALGACWLVGYAAIIGASVGLFGAVIVAALVVVMGPRVQGTIAETIFGASHRPWAGLATFCVVIAVGWGAGSLLVQALQLPSAQPQAAMLAVKILSVCAAFVLVRAANRRVSLLPAPMLAIATVLAYQATATELAFAAPHKLHLALPILVGIGGFAVGLVDVQSWRRGVDVAAAVGAIAAVVAFGTYDRWTADHATLMRGPLLGYPAHTLVNTLVDFDGDGFGAALDGADCDDFDADRRPTAIEVVGDGVDQNCNELDPQTANLPPRAMPAAVRTRAPVRPPIIFVSIDTLRADHITPIFAPNLWAFGAQSWNFVNAYAPSTHTEESLPGTFSGRYGHDWQQSGVYFGIDRTIQEVLGDLGYETIAVTAMPWLTRSVTDGWQSYDNSVGERALNQPLDMTSDAVTDLALSYVDGRNTRHPLALWVHYYDPHAPAAVVDGVAGHYGVDVRAADAAFGRLVLGMRERGLWDDAIVIVFSDHGEGHGSHGINTHTWGAYDPITKVPFMLRVPGMPPLQEPRPVSVVGVFPTIVDLLGIEGTTPRSGQSLVRIMAGEPVRPFYIEANRSGVPLVRAVVDGNWKLIFDAQRASYELFNLRSDPSEHYNLLDAAPSHAARLRQMLWTWWDTGYNDAHLAHKMALWKVRGGEWRPRVFVGAHMLENRGTARPDEPASGP